MTEPTPGVTGAAAPSRRPWVLAAPLAAVLAAGGGASGRRWLVPSARACGVTHAWNASDNG